MMIGYYWYNYYFLRMISKSINVLLQNTMINLHHQLKGITILLSIGVFVSEYVLLFVSEYVLLFVSYCVAKKNLTFGLRDSLL